MYNLASIFFVLIPVFNSCLIPFWYSKLWLLILSFCVLLGLTILGIMIRKKIGYEKKFFRFSIITAMTVSVINLFIVMLGYGIDVLAKKQKFMNKKFNIEQKVFDTIIKGKVLIKVFPTNIPAANAKIIFEDKNNVIDIISTDTKGEFEYLLKNSTSDKRIKMSVQHIECIPYQTEISYIVNGTTEIEVYLNKKVNSVR